LESCMSKLETQRDQISTPYLSAIRISWSPSHLCVKKLRPSLNRSRKGP
jgi:hypothetical protein